MNKILAIIVLFLTVNVSASSFTIVEGTKKTAKKFPEQNEITETTIQLFAEPSATSCKVWEPAASGNGVNPGMTCDLVMELPIGTKLRYTGNYTAFAAVGRKQFFNQPARGFISFEVSYETPDQKSGTGYIRAIDRSKLWGSSLPMQAAYGFRIQLPEVAKGGF